MMFHHLAQLLSQFCQFPISPGRTRQRVEQPKSYLTQPRFARRWVSLYLTTQIGAIHTLIITNPATSSSKLNDYFGRDFTFFLIRCLTVSSDISPVLALRRPP